jgi:hypothetical protein
MAEIIFRNLKDQDIPAVNDFYNNYHHTGRTIAQFRWEFEEGPHGKGIYCLAEVADTGQIIGIQGGIPIQMLTSSNKSVLTIKSEDTLVDMDLCTALKRKYLFRDLYDFFVNQCRERGAECIWGFTWASKSFIRIGFQVPFNASQGLLVNNPVKSFQYLSGLNVKNTWWQKLKIGMLVVLTWGLGMKGIFYSNIAGLSLTEGFHSNEEFSLKISETTDDMAFMKQDAAFLSWRLEKNPYPLKYRVYNFFKQDKQVGQIITSLHPNGQGYLEQMLLSPELSDATRCKIIKAAVQHLSRDGSFLIRALTFDGNDLNRQQITLLKTIGFSHLKKGMAFVFLPLNNSLFLHPDQFLLSRLFTQGHN